MAYIGAVAPGYDPTRASVPQLDAERFSGTGSATAFTLTRQVASPTDINVIVENVLQEPIVSYSVDGYTLNFTEAPGTGTNNIYVVYRASAVSNFAYVPDGSITYAKLANNIRQFTVDTFTANGTGSTIALTETPASANSLIVSVDGVIQTAPTNYTLSGSTITFTGVPDNGANVVVKHIGFRTTSTVTALQASSVTATEIADGSVTNAKIVSVANTKITGLVTASQIATVANTQITGNIISSQITSVANTQITGNIISSQITSVANTQITGNIISSQITSVANTQITGNVTATNLSGGTNGTIPYQSASGTTQMLAVGTSGQVLQTNGAGAPSWATPSTGTLVYLSTVTASSSATVDVETTFDSTYDEYLIIVSNLIPDTSNIQLLSRLKVGGSYDTGSNYSSAAVTMNSAGDSYNGNDGGTTIYMSAAYVGASRPTSFTYHVHSPASTSYAKGVHWEGFMNANGAALSKWFAGAGMNSSTSALTGVRFYLAGGNITSGTFRLYGIKKS
jgi:hypothetical protein